MKSFFAVSVFAVIVATDFTSSAFAHADEVAEAVAAITKIGGKVRQVDGEREVDFHLRGRELTDNELRHVSMLKDVVWLNLKGTRITSAGLVHLKDLHQLRSLHVEETAVGDDGIEHIANLPNLEYLNLYGTKITDQALTKLAAAKKLRKLYVWRTNITAAGTATLAAARPELKIAGGVDLAKLPSEYEAVSEPPKKRVPLEWVAVANRADAPARSENGVNCQILFENKTESPVKLYWIGYGNGDLKLYATLAPGETREQNSYSRNAWLVTDENDQPLGYFIVELDDSHAVIPDDV